jgi:hypothetical protein
MTPFLWALKLGAPFNLYLLATTFAPPLSDAPPGILIPARILLAVSAFRCLFPVIYKGHIAFHDTGLSSIFLTRFLATFSEVAYVSQLAYALHLLNAAHVGGVDALAGLMVVQVVVSQVFVWGAILTGNLMLYFFEELGWEVLFAANTLASAYLCFTLPEGGPAVGLLNLNLAFGLFYLPWQVIHLKVNLADARAMPVPAGPLPPLGARLRQGLSRALFEWTPSRSSEAWGGWVGLTWMSAYWASLIPLWVHRVVVALAHA